MRRLFLVFLIIMMTGCTIELPKEEEKVPADPVNVGVETSTRDYVIASRAGNEKGVYAIDLGSRKLYREIYKGDYKALNVSKDKLIIYRENGPKESNPELILMDLKGEIIKKIELEYPMVKDTKPVLSPNERGIFYVGEIKNFGFLYYANLEDGRVEKLPNIQGNIKYLSFKDNENFIYSRYDGVTKRNEIYEYNLKAFTEKKLFDSQYDDLSPSLSPDKTKLAFLRFINNKYVLYIKELAVENPPYCLYKDIPVEGGSLIWSNNSEYLSFITKNADAKRVKLYSFKKEITSDMGKAYTSIFSQDSHKIAYIQISDIKDLSKGEILQELYMNPLRDNNPSKIFEIPEGGVYSNSIELLLWFTGEL